MRFLSSTSTLTHYSSVKVGQIWCGWVTTERSGIRMIFVRSGLMFSDLNIKINRLKAVKLWIDLSQSSYKLNNSIYGSVAFRILSPNFSIFNIDLYGN